MASGGKRQGSGRKKKPVAERILEGKETVAVMDFNDIEVPDELPNAREFLISAQRQGKLIAKEIRKEVYTWLKERKCQKHIPPFIIDQYAMHYGRWIQLEEVLSEFGFLGKHPTTGNPQPSPFAKMCVDESKLAKELWKDIYETVQQNCTKIWSPTSEDPLARLMQRGVRKGL